MKKTAIVIGAGIVGLATTRALAARGYSVKVFERSPQAVGASIRNFGMIWPIGQPAGPLLERALLSRSIWQEVLTAAGIWFEEAGSLHLAYDDLEWQVLQELEANEKNNRRCTLWSPEETLKKSPAVVAHNLKGALFSQDEMIVDPREAIAGIPAFLEEKYGVEFHWRTAITTVNYPQVNISSAKLGSRSDLCLQRCGF